MTTRRTGELAATTATATAIETTTGRRRTATEPGHDMLTGGSGNDVFVFHKGEADGDVILDFHGRGAATGDSIELVGYAAGTTFTRVGNGSSNIYEINDHGFIEHVTIIATGQVHATDYHFVP